MRVRPYIYKYIKEEVDFKRSSPEREWLGLPAVSSSTKIFLYFFLWLRVKRSLGFLSQMDKPKTPVHMRRWETFWCVLTKEFERDFLAPRQKENKIKKIIIFFLKRKGGRRHAVCHSRVVPLLPRPLFSCCTIIFRLIFFFSPPRPMAPLYRSLLFLSFSLSCGGVKWLLLPRPIDF